MRAKFYVSLHVDLRIVSKNLCRYETAALLLKRYGTSEPHTIYIT